jgi:hypothetical protein
MRALAGRLGKWTAVAAASFVALILGTTIGLAAGGDASDEPSGESPGTVTVSSSSTVTVSETVTETVSATKAQREKLKQRAQALAERRDDVAALEREVRQDKRALERRIGVVQRNKFSDGVFIVGREVKPGTYRSRGGGGCYWARLSGFGGSDIIVNGGFSRNQTVTIFSSDRGFESSRCGSWYRIE